MKKTSVFAVAVAVLLAVTYYFEFYRVTSEEKQKAAEAKIIPYPPDQIHQVAVENEHGKVLLKRDADGWRLEEPVKDWADNTFAEDFVGGLSIEKALDVASEGEAVQWSVYGLDKNPARIAFTNQKGETTVLSVSEKKNFEGNSFLRRNQENKVLVASPQWSLRAKGRAIEFRDKRLFRGKISAVSTIGVKSLKEEFKLVQKDSKWIAEKDSTLTLNQNRIREILTSLNETTAVEYVEALPKKSTPQAKISLKLTDKDWSAELFATEEKAIYAVTSDPAFVMKLTPGQGEQFFQMTLSDLRDRKEAFDFNKLSTRRIELQTPLKKTILVKTGEVWNVEGNPEAKVDAEAVKNFLARLGESAITEFLTEKEQAGFKNPQNSILLKDENGELLLQLAWGPALTKKTGAVEKNLVLAKTNLYSEPFGLDQNVIESWGINNLFPPAKEVK